MIKTVNVRPVIPIMALRTPIMGEVVNCKMSDGDILQCIYSRAFVDEILEDGTLVRLNLTNYNKDNSHLMKNKVVKEEIKEEPVVKTPVKEPVVETIVEEIKVEEPVIIEETPVVETIVEEPTIEEVKVEEPVKEPVVEQQRDRKNNNKKNRR